MVVALLMTLHNASPCGSRNQSRSPNPKRIKLESPQPKLSAEYDDDSDIQEVVDEDHCSICLQCVVDRTILPRCAHEFCFECILVWTGQSFFLHLVFVTPSLKFRDTKSKKKLN